MNKALFILLLTAAALSGQTDSLPLRAGDKAPFFIMNADQNSIQSITMPYMNKIVLVHFWNSSDLLSNYYNRFLKRLSDRYRSASYKNADGFEIIAVAVQSDRKGWQDRIREDSLHSFVHGIAPKGFNTDVCKKFRVTEYPKDFLIDEKGVLISVNPRIVDIENILDERKNFQPLRKDIHGTLALSTSKKEAIKYGRVYLFNFYGDSIAQSLTDNLGNFSFSDVKLNQDFVLKVDNKTDILTSDPIALYSPGGDFMLDGRTAGEGFVFNITPRLAGKLVSRDTLSAATNTLGEIDVIKSLSFTADSHSLTSHDEQELVPVLVRLQRNKSFHLELITHTDARLDAQAALELTTRQAAALKNFFQSRGIPANRIKAIAKGNSELRKLCDGTIDCREEDHRLNRRVEFIVYKD